MGIPSHCTKVFCKRPIRETLRVPLPDMKNHHVVLISLSVFGEEKTNKCHRRAPFDQLAAGQTQQPDFLLPSQSGLELAECSLVP